MGAGYNARHGESGIAVPVLPHNDPASTMLAMLAPGPPVYPTLCPVDRPAQNLTHCVLGTHSPSAGADLLLAFLCGCRDRDELRRKLDYLELQGGGLTDKSSQSAVDPAFKFRVTIVHIILVAIIACECCLAECCLIKSCRPTEI